MSDSEHGLSFEELKESYQKEGQALFESGMDRDDVCKQQPNQQSLAKKHHTHIINSDAFSGSPMWYAADLIIVDCCGAIHYNRNTRYSNTEARWKIKRLLFLN